MEPDEGILNRLKLSYDNKYTTEPILDEYTLKMTAAFRRAQKADFVDDEGVITCACGRLLINYDYILPDGTWTCRLAVHYLAHHRSKVPLKELEKVSQLEVDYDPEREPPPTPKELRPEGR